MRISQAHQMLKMAKIVAQRGTCSRLQVGAAVHRDFRVIATGYNGALSGMDHCEHWSWRPGESVPDAIRSACEEIEEANPGAKASWGEVPLFLDNGDLTIGGDDGKPCTKAVHAEANAIAFCARYGISTDGAAITVTHQPCLKCAQLIIAAGIEVVWYSKPYRDRSGLDLLRDAGLSVHHQLGVPR